jgi:hypothetical protein
MASFNEIRANGHIVLIMKFLIKKSLSIAPPECPEVQHDCALTVNRADGSRFLMGFQPG